MARARCVRLHNGLDFDINKKKTGVYGSGLEICTFPACTFQDFIGILWAIYVSLRVSRITPTTAISEAYKAAIGKPCSPFPHATR